jgi:hypothetical protein
MSDYLTGSIVALVSFALGLSGKIIYDFWHDNHVDKTQRQKEALKTHFSDLQKNYIKPTSDFLWNISNQNGILISDMDETHDSIDLDQTTWPINSIDRYYQCFKSHFPREANILLELEKDVKKINSDNREANKELSSLLVNKTKIPIYDYNKRIDPNIASFYSLIITFIRFSLSEQVKKPSNELELYQPKFDFREVTFSQNNINSNKLEVCLKDGRVLAEVNNIEEANTCKNALIEITKDTALALKTNFNNSIANSQKTLIKSISNEFDQICEIYGKFGSILKKKRGCPICKLIH